MKKVCLTLILLLTGYTPSSEKGIVADKSLESIKKANFKVAFTYLIKHEGYYANIEHDRGKETYAGITQRYNPQWYGWKYVQEEKKLKSLKNNERIPKLDFWVLDFYLDVWVTEQFYMIKDQQVANYLFDFRIHSGYSGIKLIKTVVKQMGYNMSEGKKFNEQDFLIINQLYQPLLLSKLKKARITYYKNIVHRDSTQSIFLNTWLTRAKEQSI